MCNNSTITIRFHGDKYTLYYWGHIMFMSSMGQCCFVCMCNWQTSSNQPASGEEWKAFIRSQTRTQAMYKEKGSKYGVEKVCL